MKLVPDSNDSTKDSTAGVQPLLRDLRSMSHHAQQLQQSASTLAAEVQSTSVDFERYLTDRVRNRPFSTLGAAAGVGYLVGGGLRTPLTVMLLGAFARLVAAQVVRELSGIAGQMGSQSAYPAAPPGEPVA